MASALLVELRVACPGDIGYAALSRLLDQLDSKKQAETNYSSTKSLCLAYSCLYNIGVWHVVRDQTSLDAYPALTWLTRLSDLPNLKHCMMQSEDLFVL